MKISALIPCYNEEKNVEASILSCLNQSRKFDQIIFVDDFSTDGTPEILARYSDRITAIRTPKNTGNKSSAQEFGLKFVTGNIMITTDADTVLDKDFVKEMASSFKNRSVVAVAGRVQSIPYNWLTLCRAYDYIIGQRIHKLAQNYINYIFVMPGAASAFRTESFKKNVTFDHDTITEDLDFTYKLHFKNLQIGYNPQAISYTQDPADLKNYINQMRRWFGGGWQNLLKHYNTAPSHPVQAFELSLLYSEGLIFSVLFFLIPLLNPWFGLWLLVSYLIVGMVFAIWAAIKDRRPALLLAPFPYIILIFINAYIYLEQFVIEIILKKKNLIWFKPERVDL
jgi:cellulose synthase/poly-beta-1,6-N-acetylglucosamine synthase-like glycosyltransferase